MGTLEDGKIRTNTQNSNTPSLQFYREFYDE